MQATLDILVQHYTTELREVEVVGQKEVAQSMVNETECLFEK